MRVITSTTHLSVDQECTHSALVVTTTRTNVSDQLWIPIKNHFDIPSFYCDTQHELHVGEL